MVVMLTAAPLREYPCPTRLLMNAFDLDVRFIHSAARGGDIEMTEKNGMGNPNPGLFFDFKGGKQGKPFVL